jgi:multidrug resistance efflux pump
VLDILVRPGDVVAAGEEIARIDATELRARMLRQQREFELSAAENARTLERSAAAHQRIAGALKRKRALLAQRVQLSGAVVKDRIANERRARAMLEQGVASQADAASASIASRTSPEHVVTLKQEVADIDIELAEREKALGAERLLLEKAEKQAEAELLQSRTLLELSSVRSPEKGVVESLGMSPGQVIEAGAVLARVVPVGALTGIVAFVPSRDASFVRTGIPARIEFPSLPVGEYGRLNGKVTRVSSDVASEAEISAVLGSDSPPASVVRVEIELVPGPELDSVRTRLRSGARVLARLRTRDVPVAVLLFEFVRKWYPS